MRNAVAGAALASIVVMGLVANGLPSILYRMHHGPSPVTDRRAWEAEYFGMKIAQLLLPVDAHRLQALRQLKEQYSAHAPLSGENGATSLGLVGGVGFLVLLEIVVSGRRQERSHNEALRPLAVLNLFAVLLGTIGGFGSLFALLISPQIRTYCRVNVFIGFLSLFAVVLLLDCLRRRRPGLALCTLPIVLVLASSIRPRRAFEQCVPRRRAKTRGPRPGDGARWGRHERDGVSARSSTSASTRTVWCTCRGSPTAS